MEQFREVKQMKSLHNHVERTLPIPEEEEASLFICCQTAAGDTSAPPLSELFQMCPMVALVDEKKSYWRVAARPTDLAAFEGSNSSPSISHTLEVIRLNVAEREQNVIASIEEALKKEAWRRQPLFIVLPTTHVLPNEEWLEKVNASTVLKSFEALVCLGNPCRTPDSILLSTERVRMEKLSASTLNAFFVSMVGSPSSSTKYELCKLAVETCPTHPESVINVLQKDTKTNSCMTSLYTLALLYRYSQQGGTVLKCILLKYMDKENARQFFEKAPSFVWTALLPLLVEEQKTVPFSLVERIRNYCFLNDVALSLDDTQRSEAAAALECRSADNLVQVAKEAVEFVMQHGELTKNLYGTTLQKLVVNGLLFQKESIMAADPNVHNQLFPNLEYLSAKNGDIQSVSEGYADSYFLNEPAAHENDKWVVTIAEPKSSSIGRAKSAIASIANMFAKKQPSKLTPETVVLFLYSLRNDFDEFLSGVVALLDNAESVHETVVGAMLKPLYTPSVAEKFFKEMLNGNSKFSRLSIETRWLFLLRMRVESTPEEPMEWMQLIKWTFTRRWKNSQDLLKDMGSVSRTSPQQCGNGLRQSIIDFFTNNLLDATASMRALLEYTEKPCSAEKVTALEILLNWPRVNEEFSESHFEPELVQRIADVSEEFKHFRWHDVLKLCAWMRSHHHEDGLFAEARATCDGVLAELDHYHEMVHDEMLLLDSLERLDPELISNVEEGLYQFRNKDSYLTRSLRLETAIKMWTNTQKIITDLGDEAIHAWRSAVVENESRLFESYTREEKDWPSPRERIMHADGMFRELFLGRTQWGAMGKLMRLVRENRLVVEDELSKLQSCYEGESASWHDLIDILDEQRFLTVHCRDLQQLVCGSKEAPSILRSFGFSCREDTACGAFDVLKEAPTNSSGEKCNRRTTIPTEIFETLDVIFKDIRPAGVLNIVRLLSSLSECKRLWSFFEEHPAYVDPSGAGYTEEFNTVVSDLHYHLRDENQVLLEEFQNFGFYIAMLLGCRTQKTLRELVQVMLQNEQVRKSCETRTKTEQCIHSLLATDQRVPEIDEFFSYGAGDLDHAQKQCECLSNGAIVEVSLPSGAARLFYEEPDTRQKDHKLQTVKEIGSDDLSTFIQWARFLSSKGEDEVAKEAKKCVDHLTRIISAVPTLQELRALGDGRFITTKIHIRCMGGLSNAASSAYTDTFMDYAELDVLEVSLNDCKAHLRREMDGSPALSHYFVPEALYMLSRLQESMEIFSSLVYPNLRDITLTAAPHLNNKTSWTDTLKDVLESLSPGGLWRCTPVSADTHGGRQFKCTSHSSVLATLARIYDKRAPLPFELLWCDTATSDWAVEQFIRRATVHEEYHFTLVHVDRLPYKSILHLSALLHDQSHTGLRNVDVIETAEATTIPSLLPKPTTRRGESVPTLRQVLDCWGLRGSGSESGSRNWKCYVGPPGCGKSFQVKQDAAKLPKSHRRCCFVIHEGFTREAALEAVRSVVEAAPTEDLFIGIEISIGLFTEVNRERGLRWLEDVNTFLFDLLVCHRVCVPETGSFVLLQENHLRHVSIELPDSIFLSDDGMRDVSDPETMFPLVMAACQDICANKIPTHIGDDLLPLGRYLKAYDEGTIDTLCRRESTSVFILLDISTSMRKSQKLESAKHAIREFLERNLSNLDDVGLAVFNRSYRVLGQLGPATGEWKATLCAELDNVVVGVGTRMWSAICDTSSLFPSESKKLQWIVVFSDGESGGTPLTLKASSLTPNQSIVFLGVELQSHYERIVKEGLAPFKKSHVHVMQSVSDSAIHRLFQLAAGHLFVSYFIETQYRDMSLEECRSVIESRVSEAGCTTQLQRNFWLQYMQRRHILLKGSDQFNLNETHQSHGSMTMRTMLSQAKLAVTVPDGVEKMDNSREEMIYWREKKTDGTCASENCRWSILPVDSVDDKARWEDTQKRFEGTGMYLPPPADLQRGDVLQSYVAHALDVPLCNATVQSDSTGKEFDFSIGTLPDDGFIWTRDFAFKMIRVNEQIECGVPCVLIGETGVSKTALLEECFKLKNRHFCATDSIIWRVCQCGDKNGALHALYSETTGKNSITLEGIDNSVMLERLMYDFYDWDGVIRNELIKNPSLSALPDLKLNALSDLEDKDTTARFLSHILDAYLSQSTEGSATLKALFHVVNVHAAMTVQEIETEVRTVAERAESVLRAGRVLNSPGHSKLKLCLFFDEMNTTPFMGLMKEIMVNRCLNGVPLPPNVVPIAAVNPYRRKLSRQLGRKEEQGEEWLSGHYNVQPLPPSLQSVAWSYGSLAPRQEREFIMQRAERVKGIPPEAIETVTDYIDVAHQLVRQMAAMHMQSIARDCNELQRASIENYAASALSLRDIIRCFEVLDFYRHLSGDRHRVLVGYAEDSHDWKTPLLLSIAVTYFLRLGQLHAKKLSFREHFAREFKNRTNEDIEPLIARVVQALGDETTVQRRIAKTQGLLENIYVSLICLLAVQPILIIGPPGTSKTLAITILLDNTRGVSSSSSFYRNLPGLKVCRYQCSRHSTSSQIRSVYECAIRRQKRNRESNSSTRWFVFMDEAGLPEEKREGLKILHYYLERPRMHATGVGFIAISNHVLDAAKSNRCAVVSRERPSVDELLRIAKVCLCSEEELATIQCSLNGGGLNCDVVVDGSGGDGLLNRLCRAFSAAMKGVQPLPSDSLLPPPPQFNGFFGQRDFISCVKCIGRGALAQRPHTITDDTIYNALETNFNGLPRSETLLVVNFFLDHLKIPLRTSESLENSVKLFTESFGASSSEKDMSERRYFLVVDPTTNDTVYREILRILPPTTHGLKLSSFSSDNFNQEAEVTGAVCFHARHTGYPVLLSNSDLIHESLYNLFNKHFTVTVGNEGKEYRTEVAVGSATRLIRVRPTFHTVVHVTLEQLAQLPAPFLDRFEKYYITPADMLQHTISGDTTLHRILRTVTVLVQRSVEALFNCVDRCAFFGISDEENAVATFLTHVYRQWTDVETIAEEIHLKLRDDEPFKSNLSSLMTNEGLAANLNLSVAEMKEKMCSLEEDDVHWTQLAVGKALQRDVFHRLFAVAVPEVLLSQWETVSSAPLIGDLLSLSPAFDSPRFDSVEGKRKLFFTRAGRLPQMAHIRVVHLAEFMCESDLHRALNEHWDGKQPTVVLIDTQRTPVTQINYVRSVIDAKFKEVGDCRNPITLVVQVASSELVIHHPYDVTFTSPWDQQFFDDLHQTPETLAWVRYAYTTTTSPEEMSVALQRRLPLSLKKLAGMLRKKTVASSTGYVEKSFCEEELSCLLDTEVYGKALLQRLLERFERITSSVNEGVAEPFMKLVEDIQGAVVQRAVGALDGSIADIVNQSVGHIFDHFIQKYCVILLDFVSCDTAQAEMDDEAISVLCTGLELVNVGVDDVRKPIQPVTVLIPPRPEMPYMNAVKALLESVVERVGPDRFDKASRFTKGCDEAKDETVDTILSSVSHPMMELFRRCYCGRSSSRFAAVYLQNMMVYSFPRTEKRVVDEIVAAFKRQASATTVKLSDDTLFLWVHSFVRDPARLENFIQSWTCLVTLRDLGNVNMSVWDEATANLLPSGNDIVLLAYESLSLDRLDYGRLRRWMRALSSVQLNAYLGSEAEDGKDPDDTLTALEKVDLMCDIAFTAVVIYGDDLQKEAVFTSAVTSHLRMITGYDGSGDTFLEAYWEFLNGPQDCPMMYCRRYAFAAAHVLSQCGYATLHMGNRIEAASPHSLDTLICVTCDAPFVDPFRPSGEKVNALPPFSSWVCANVSDELNAEVCDGNNEDLFVSMQRSEGQQTGWSFRMAFLVLATRTLQLIYPAEHRNMGTLIAELRCLLDLQGQDPERKGMYNVASEAVRLYLLEAIAVGLQSHFDAVVCFFEDETFQDEMSALLADEGWTSLFVGWLRRYHTPKSTVQELHSKLQANGTNSAFSATWMESVLIAFSPLPNKKDASRKDGFQATRFLREHWPNPSYHTHTLSDPQYDFLLDKACTVPLLCNFYARITAATCQGCLVRPISDISNLSIAGFLAEHASAAEREKWNYVCTALQLIQDVWPGSPRVEGCTLANLKVCDVVSSLTEQGVKNGLLVDTVRFLLRKLEPLNTQPTFYSRQTNANQLDKVTGLCEDVDTFCIPFRTYDSVRSFLGCNATIHTACLADSFVDRQGRVDENNKGEWGRIFSFVLSFFHKVDTSLCDVVIALDTRDASRDTMNSIHSVLHSLSFSQLVALQELVAQILGRGIQDELSDETLSTLLERHRTGPSLCCELSGFTEEQLHWIHLLPVKELLPLQAYCRSQQEQKAYLFADRDVTVKTDMPPELKRRLTELLDSGSAEQLERWIVEREITITQKPTTRLYTIVRQSYWNEDRVPHFLNAVKTLARESARISSDNSLDLLGCHYVSLRLQLFEMRLSRAPKRTTWNSDRVFVHPDDAHSSAKVMTRSSPMRRGNGRRCIQFFNRQLSGGVLLPREVEELLRRMEELCDAPDTLTSSALTMLEGVIQDWRAIGSPAELTEMVQRVNDIITQIHTMRRGAGDALTAAMDPPSSMMS
ncbi:hypothetical protein STCU_11075 [Strigomonas culicis]|uniref:VWFA domain-containing protein n=1 Tax=Strigomonas culicis TaxID=28005 RepID=S9UPV9_9TRYP|nr:hypothetical protein STCU_11075 [Strigomonas culicis]|eukprot:EPY16656.1 hypothetical protein STCU_11075 [Strigomonas culicis]